jgi:hypothetical protein
MDVPALPLEERQEGVMGLNLDFGRADFRGLSQEDQIARCREMAIKAIRLASNASAEKRDQYIDLATRWCALAAEMQCHNRPELEGN